MLLIAAGTASAEGFAWSAPDSCPSRDAVLERVARHLVALPDPALIEVVVDVRRENGVYVAQIDAPGVGIVRQRTLTSRKCSDLADAVGVIVARLAIEASDAAQRAATDRAVAAAAKVRDAADLVAIQKMIELDDAPVRRSTHGACMVPRGVPTSDVRCDASASPEAVVHEAVMAATVPVDPRARGEWGGGLRALAVSGVGAMPGIGLGADLGGYVRHRQAFYELAAVHWRRATAAPMSGGISNFDLGLDTVVVRVGYLPDRTMLRTWLGGEVGRLHATGESSLGGDAATPWVAVGGGVGVAWPIADTTRLVGTFEVLVPLTRQPLALENGQAVPMPASANARCALGLEVGWR